MTMQPASVQVRVTHGAPVSLVYATIENGSVTNRDGLMSPNDYTVDYVGSTVTFADSVRMNSTTFDLRADLPGLPPPQPAPDYGADAADIDRMAADAAIRLRAFIALTPPTQADVVANAKFQNRVLLALMRRVGL